MKLNEEKKIKHVARISAGCFIGSVLTYLLILLFGIYPDLSTNPPTILNSFLTLGQISTSLLILGCVAHGIKLADEKKIIHAIGFTMLSIAQGVIFVLFIFSYNGHEKIEEAMRMFSASLYLLIPSIILIAFYSEFPMWVNLIGIIACILYIIENFMFNNSGKLTTTLGYVDGVANILFNTTVLCWGIIILRNAKREINELKNKAEISS